MVLSSIWILETGKCPVPKGDGLFSQAWEWFGANRLPSCECRVHSTGVGMIRQLDYRYRHEGSSFHRRGNDSMAEGTDEKKGESIPQVWE